MESHEEIRIGDQIWMMKNLNVEHFRNGDHIIHAGLPKAWVSFGESGKTCWCHYDNLPENGLRYGKLYNWFTVIDPRGLAPLGWHVPSKEEWTRLVEFLGGEGRAGVRMKNTSGWGRELDGYNGTNESGLAALPGGYRRTTAEFIEAGQNGYWWSATEWAGKAWDLSVHAFGNYVFQDTLYKAHGFSVRCVKD